MSKKKKAFSLGLNFIAPGLGQFALKWWFRGCLQLTSTCILLIWSMWEALYPIYGRVYDKLQNTPGQHTAEINFTRLILIIIGMCLIWIWSFLEIIIFYNPNEENKEKKSEDETSNNYP